MARAGNKLLCYHIVAALWAAENTFGNYWSSSTDPDLGRKNILTGVL